MNLSKEELKIGDEIKLVHHVIYDQEEKRIRYINKICKADGEDIKDNQTDIILHTSSMLAKVCIPIDKEGYLTVRVLYWGIDIKPDDWSGFK